MLLLMVPPVSKILLILVGIGVVAWVGSMAFGFLSEYIKE